MSRFIGRRTSCSGNSRPRVEIHRKWYLDSPPSLVRLHTVDFRLQALSRDPHFPVGISRFPRGSQLGHNFHLFARRHHRVAHGSGTLAPSLEKESHFEQTHGKTPRVQECNSNSLVRRGGSADSQLSYPSSDSEEVISSNHELACRSNSDGRGKQTDCSSLSPRCYGAN